MQPCKMWSFGHFGVLCSIKGFWLYTLVLLDILSMGMHIIYAHVVQWGRKLAIAS